MITNFRPFHGMIIASFNIEKVYRSSTLNLKAEVTMEFGLDFELNPEAIGNLQKIFPILAGKCYKDWERFLKIKDLDEIENFGKQLRNLGESNKITALVRYSQELLKASDSFDLESMDIILERYPRLLETLQEFAKKE